MFIGTNPIPLFLITIPPPHLNSTPSPQSTTPRSTFERSGASSGFWQSLQRLLRGQWPIRNLGE